MLVTHHAGYGAMLAAAAILCGAVMRSIRA
jgi:hypothetical protein